MVFNGLTGSYFSGPGVFNASVFNKASLNNYLPYLLVLLIVHTHALAFIIQLNSYPSNKNQFYILIISNIYLESKSSNLVYSISVWSISSTVSTQQQ